MKYQIAVVEDDKNYANQLISYLKRYEKEAGYSYQIHQFSDGIDIVDGYTGQYDLIFLDIEMPHMDGMNAAEKIRTMDEDVLMIFVTNLAQYAIRGYGVKALDYVLKPITYPAFVMKLQRAMKILDKREDRYVLISTEKGTKRVAVSDVYYVEVADHLLTYHTSCGAYSVFGSLKELEREYQESFSRINHNYLVNMKYVDGFTDEQVQVQGVSLKMSRSKRKDFVQRLTRFYQTGGN